MDLQKNNTGVAKESPLERLTERLDNLVRHRGWFGRHHWLRNLLRKPYHRLLNWHGRGIRVIIGGCVVTRLPPEFSGRNVEKYETVEFRILRDWCQSHLDGLFVDVGCAIGYYSCAALFSSSTVEVVAIDSDLNSLKATQRFCKYASGRRLTLLQGMIADSSTCSGDYHAAARATSAAISFHKVTGDPGSTWYRNLDLASPPKDIPAFRLDDLLAGVLLLKKPVLIKVDVEGAEWHVLNGAKRVLDICSPVILLSVHPSFLPRYNKTVADVQNLLSAAGYTTDLLGKDHEEHWLCHPIPKKKDPNIAE